MSIKKRLSASLPLSFHERYRSLRRWLEARRNRRRSAEEVFSDIYKRRLWGGAEDDYCSGAGSCAENLVEPYVAAVKQKLQELAISPLTIVDLGCGDFRLGSRFVDVCDHYIGVDIVPEIVARNSARFGSDRVRFERRNIITDPLPSGDVCFLRQVLQHLSNQQISQILPRLMQYRHVFITEHYPSRNGMVPNLDKVQGSDIRLYRNSGVYLDKAPFNIDPEKLELLMELPAPEFGRGIDPGVLRTFFMTNR